MTSWDDRRNTNSLAQGLWGVVPACAWQWATMVSLMAAAAGVTNSRDPQEGSAVAGVGQTMLCRAHSPLLCVAVCCAVSCPQDIARLTLAALRSDQCENRTLTFAGPSAYTTREVIEMCERMSDSTAKVTSVPTWLLRATRNILKSADWARDAADRLVSRGQGLGWDTLVQGFVRFMWCSLVGSRRKREFGLGGRMFLEGQGVVVGG